MNERKPSRKRACQDIQLSFRAVGQTHAEWQTFEKLENKRQMYGSQAWVD